MTVQSTNITAGPYDGNDVADTFAYLWGIQNKNQVTVYEIDDQGEATILTVDTDYTVSDIGEDAGGDITRVAGALPTGYQWYILSNFQLTQETDFNSQSAFLPDVHEAAFDKLTRLVQQLLEIGERSVRASPTAFGLDLILPDATANYLVAWNENADALRSIPIPESIIPSLSSEPDPNVYNYWYDVTQDDFKFYNGSTWVSTSTIGVHTIWLPAASASPSMTEPPLFTREELTNKASYSTYEFDYQGNEEYIQFDLQMPKSWDGGTLVFQFVWSPNNGTVSKNVTWGIEGFAVGDGEALTNSFGTAVEVTDVTGGNDTCHLSPETAALTLGGTPEGEEFIVLRVYRDNTVTDNFTGRAKLLGVKLHYTTNTHTDE